MFIEVSFTLPANHVNIEVISAQANSKASVEDPPGLFTRDSRLSAYHRLVQTTGML